MFNALLKTVVDKKERKPKWCPQIHFIIYLINNNNNKNEIYL